MEKSKSVPEYSYRDFGFQDRPTSYDFNGPVQKGNGFSTSDDAEVRRKRRIAAYNVFAMERKVKSSLRNSFKWIKGKFTDSRYGL